MVFREGGAVPDVHANFRAGEILTWPAWQRWAQLAFPSQAVHCPNRCPFSGTPAQTDDQQARVCPRRVIACPVDRCTFMWPAAGVEHAHFTTCPLMRIDWMKCRLPLRVSKLKIHDCLKEQKAALQSMLSTQTNSILTSNFYPYACVSGNTFHLLFLI